MAALVAPQSNAVGKQLPSKAAAMKALHAFGPSKRPAGARARVSNVDVPVTGGWRSIEERIARGPCSQCGLAADEKADDGNRYCLKCWDEWDKKAIQEAPEVKDEGKKSVLNKAVAARDALAAAKAKVAAAQAKKEEAAAADAAEREAAVAASKQAFAARKGVEGSMFFICGSWDSFLPHEMVYNHGRGCFLSTVVLGESGNASFKILMDGDEEKCLLDKTWCIDDAAGLAFEVTLRVEGDVQTVNWTKRGMQEASAPARRYWINGAWDKCSAHEMVWDPVRQCFHYFVQLGFMEEESFQLLVNGDSEKCLYPEWPHGSFHTGDAMLGPDCHHRGKHWTIGRHKNDKAEEDAVYEVRLRVKADGSAKFLDWVKLDASGADPEAAPTAEAVKVCEEAVRLYGQRMSEAVDDEVSSDDDDETAEPSQSGSGSSDTEEPSAESRMELEQDLAEWRAPEAAKKGLDMEVDSDGEEVHLCRHCGLPLGDFGYTASEGNGKFIHGECMAQKVIDDMRKEDEDRIKEDAALKKKKRMEYDIGWKVERVPRSLSLAKKLQCCTSVPQGMCCLVLDRESKTVRIAPTMEPAASVNLPYLAMALQVRLKEGKEPWFSLDPVDAARAKELTHYDPKLDPEKTMQVKRFEPAWLAGTRLGEAMFQADYHLKELSMGEYEQPVIGMRSCHDFAETDGLDKEWSAREWFVINKAQVQISDDDVLLPFVKMGVEAREQIRGDHGLEDARITRPDHPMVKYAELFTENFDLIAERKSVVFHLREVAKATVMAKYLVDARVNLDDCWFNMAEDEMSTCVMEIPQLWNERTYSKVHVADGKIRGISEGIAPETHGVYGGVQLAVPGVPSMVPGVPVAMAAVAPTRQAARIAPAVVGVSAMGRLVRAGPGGAAIRPGPKGVDLNLGQFDLSEATSVEGSWAGKFQCSDPSLVVGGAFWSSLDNNVLKDADMFKAVFNSALSDRRDEGDRFVPPDTSPSHLRRLKELVQAEERLRQERKSHFFSASFSIDSAGPLFPRSWSNSIEITGTSERSSLHLRPDLKHEAVVLDQALQSAAPTFDKTTEDGLRFRVYRLGSLELRTTQEQDGYEVVGAVLSTRLPGAACEKGQEKLISEEEKLVKVTEYVERAQRSASGYRYYAVLQTETSAMVTELLENGSVAFEANPANLEDRTSLAKVLRSTNCRSARVSVADMRKHVEAKSSPTGASASMRKRFARGVFRRVGGEARTKKEVQAVFQM